MSVAPAETRVSPLFVPQGAEELKSLAAHAEHFVAERALVAPMTLNELRSAASDLADRLDLPAPYHEFLLVLIHNAAWQGAVAAVPFDRRTLLLPPCLRPRATCTAEFDEFGLLCRRCGGCEIGRLSDEAEALGYAVLVAEGTSVVAALIEQGMIDAVVGVSCMTSLEKTFPHTLKNAIPGIAVPLLREGCEDTLVNAAWVRRVLTLREDGGPRRLDLDGIHRLVRGWFTPGAIEFTLTGHDSDTERVALDWLAKSGKRWRPFLAVTVFLAMSDDVEPDALPEYVRRVAVALECIHKASLIYDDIQDDDATRYGDDTLHRVHGVPVALTASLYLLGQGYRLIADSGAPPEQRAQMITLATEAHCELCRGQGAELWWMRRPTALSLDDVLRICRAKTAPSFEVVFRLGALCAGASPGEHAVLRAYSEAVGTAYQVQDDLADFQSGGDVDDVASRRPSVPIAVALENADPAVRDTICAFWTGRSTRAPADELRRMMRAAGAEEKTRALLEELKNKARLALAPLRNQSLKILLYRLLAKILPDPEA